MKWSVTQCKAGRVFKDKRACDYLKRAEVYLKLHYLSNKKKPGRICSRKKEGILPFLHEREEIHMRKFYTAEAVTEGHPDKVCDQIADAILDMCLKNDADSKVACEVLATKGTVIVAGEITSTYEPDVFGVIQKVLSEVGYSSEGVAMDTFVHQQSPDIANAVRESKEKKGRGV